MPNITLPDALALLRLPAPDPAQRVPLTPRALAPLFALYYLQAVLVLLPHTRVLRVALLPPIFYLAYTAAVTQDFARGVIAVFPVLDPERVVCWNYAYVIATMVIALRAFEWACVPRPYRRYEAVPEQGKAPRERPLTALSALADAGELLCNQRGLGWSWSRQPFPPTAPTTTPFRQFRSLVFKLTIFDAIHYLLQHFVPALDRASGTSIFDPALPPVQRYAQSTLITLGAGLIVYTTVDVLYLAGALAGQLLLGQPAAAWPPLSARPWCATSLADFWGRRWHQFFRRVFVAAGARPLGALLGPAGAVAGAFGVSAVLHDAGMWGLGRGTEFWAVGGFFLVSGAGVLLERAWAGVSRREVRGVAGWAWTMAWTVGWGGLMVDAWARRGLVGSDFLPEAWRPGKMLLVALATGRMP
ncbi:hypothetical protein FA95DRAFT_1547023 [Auriscalpium vulgare]|uniref:Uncharacterized protein n=1 Tax=Auriscalpium vulgare TaxID=40419 RepID=A0ACB8RFR0_9AGAM|nr:hypothetical protein FA95DRAFT_1547023 [Auriscalpium vulgare]